MRISVKGRYALAASICMAESTAVKTGKGDYMTVISISERLGISKIYLEQVFSLLKRAGLVNSVKGSQGGYQLARMPRQITVLDVLAAVESTLFETTEATVAGKAPEIDAAMRIAAFDQLDQAIRASLGQVTLADLLSETEKHKPDRALMFYI